MGRIKKVAAERHTASLTPFVSTFVQEAASAPLHQLPAKLDSFPQPWQFPRGDLYHWIPLLDRFDHILEIFNKEYGLDQGPQQQPFECRLLLRGDAEEGMPYPSEGAQRQELDGFTSEGDRELVESVVSFTKMLFEHCGNRSIYASSSHIGTLLFTTSLSLLLVALRLGLRLAQRFQAAKYRNGPHSHTNLMAQHYNFNLDNLSKIAQTFPKPPHTANAVSATPGKGKEKASQSHIYNPCDLTGLAREPKATTAKGDVASVHLTYYEQSAPRPLSSHQSSEATPATPTPARRSSALGPSRDRPGIERSATGDVSSTPVKPKEVDTVSSAPKQFNVTAAKVSGTPAWALVREAMPKVPKDSQYDVLNRVRVAKALSTPEESAQHLLEARLLGIANFFYAGGESKFQEKVGIPDNEEPKRFHLAHQLCDLLQPPTNGQIPLSLECETAVIYALEALSKMRHKAAEVADALQISQNHGVIYFELRKVIATMNVASHEDKKLEARETKWREAVFDLTNALLQGHTQPKQGHLMVSAGIMSILIEALTLHTARAERFHEKVLLFFDSFIHGISTAFTTLANIKGFEILAELISHDATSAMEDVREGRGMPPNQKSKVIDYAIPFPKQATLRQLFKFVTHMYEHNAGTHDRLLRNFIDTPQVLGALRNVIEKGDIFGANVWTAAVSIVSNFIHNEPTSFQVVSEAGLVKSILQTITTEDLDQLGDTPATPSLSADEVRLKYNENGELQWPAASGILPVPEAMVEIPTAFGAICLNESGMKLFKQSHALYYFMDVFVSRAHVTALEEDGSSASSIGQSFDELSRHHPQLKEQIVWVVITMVKRVGEVCKYLAEREAVGSKLYERTATGISVAGGQQALAGQPAAEAESRIGATHTAETKRAEQQQDDDRGKAMPFISACFKFLEGFFHNNSMCQSFCEQGGAIYLLDVVASASAPHDITSFPVWSKFAPVFKSMVEQKPHLVLPSLIQRTQAALAGLKPLLDSQNPDGAFSSFFDLSKPQVGSLPGLDGTTVVKSLGMANLLTQILGRALAPPPYHRTHTQPASAFTTVNFTDVYIEMVDSLTQLHAVCLWENLILQKSLPEKWKGQTEPKPLMLRRINANGFVEIAQESRWDAQANGNGSANANASGPLPDDQEERLAIKNARTVRYLLNQTPHGIECFLHSLAQAIIPYKRSNMPTVKQEAGLVGENMAKSLAWELDYRRFSSADEATVARYTVSALTACTRVLTKNSGADFGFTKEALTMVLNKFYLADGFSKLNTLLNHFCNVLVTDEDEKNAALDSCARDGLSIILGFYKEVVRHKCITEANQSAAMSVRDNKQADYFMPGQFVVEIRDIVLPAVSKLWHSSALEKIGVNHAKTIIEIMRIILKGEGEDRAIKRSEKATRRVQATKFEFKIRGPRGEDDTVREIQARGNEEFLAREAVYRCNYNNTHASEYCRFRKTFERAPRFPVPGDDKKSGAAATEAKKGLVDESSSDSGAALQRQQSVEMTDAAGDGDAQPPTSDVRETADTTSSEDDEEPFRVGNLPEDVQDRDLLAMAGGGGRLQEILNYANGGSSNVTTNPSAGLPAKDTHQPFVTVEDLDDRRNELRKDMLDRCLEVLSAQKSITFELADLIQAAVAKSGDSASPRAEIGSTLVSSLMSLQGEEPSEESGAKISAYAHLIALILQDQDFFYSTLDELKEYFDSLVDWITLSPEQKMEDAPWVEMILLIIERVLTEDEQPPEVQWIPPPPDDPLKALPVVELPEPVVSAELKTSLFDAVVDLLPKIGKNSSLALSAARVLVILTRNRPMAKRMSDKHSMSKLFVMIRQMAGSVNEKLQGAFMIILRHMIEDEQIVRQIMQTEIRALFETHRTNRPMDTSTYTRHLYHLAIRDPDLFVSATQETVEVVRYDGNPHRGQTIAMKKEKPAESEQKPAGAEEAGVQPTVEAGPSSDEKKVVEVKPPTVETTDGVIQYLLRELSNYRDVEDKPPALLRDQNTQTQNGSSDDVDMADATAPGTSNGSPAQQTETNSKPEKVSFKPEEHAIFIYRCFLMQCLSELLSSYNRTKVEFINFSRKAEAQPATPAKPRSGTLNYLLNMLIPVGTLEHTDEIGYRKKFSTSNWATTVLVSLCSKTPERQTPREIRMHTAKEDNAELTFVQKFVLEHALRSFKDATSSTEPLDQRYSRLLGLAELFNRMLGAKSDRNNPIAQEASAGVARHIGKLMYEKNFVSAITSAVAEIDLNFPNAKRAVKYLLNPLKQLTDLGLYLSQDADFSSSAIGTSEEDEISSATSVSEGDDQEEREQTPDLYRNSTLGMFEAGRSGREDSDSESEDDEDDEDMYDDGYEEEMDYEDEQMAEHGDVVSDDDDEIDAMGDDMGEVEGVHGDPADMDIELVMDGEGDDMDDSSDDDDDSDNSEDDDEEAFGHDMNAMDEITGDDENASMADDHDEEGEWEEDGEGFGFEVDEGGSPHGGPLDEIARVIGADDTSDAGEQQDVIDLADGDGEYFEDEMAPDEEEEEEVDYGHDVIYEPEVEGLWNELQRLLRTFRNFNAVAAEDEEDEPGTQWDFDAPPPPAAILRGHHHHHHRHGGLQEMFALGMGGPPRAHRSTSNSRGDDDGTNPLLQREVAAQHRDRDAGIDQVAGRFARRPAMPRPGEALIQDLVATMGPGNNGTINISVDGPLTGGRGSPFLNGMFAIRGGNGAQLLDIDPARLRDHLPRFAEMHAHGGHASRTTQSGDEAQAIEFRSMPSVTRWQEEAKMLFGGKYHEKATRIINAILRVLVPPAMEAKRQADIEEAKRKMEAEAQRQREEEERKAREEHERKEREEREAREAEEKRAREEAERQEAEARGESSMEGVEAPKPVEESPEGTEQTQAGQSSAAAEEAPRITTTIRGRTLDITNLGIDLEYLEALPEDMREEVIMAQFAEQRSQQAQAGEEPSEISREFLDALPPEIQRELIRSEAMDRRRREREEAQRQAREQNGGQAPQPEEMNNADFMATLDPALRQQILMDADEGVIAALPEEFQAEARVLGGDGRPRAGRLGRSLGADAIRTLAGRHPGQAEQEAREGSRQRRPIIQMLDKAGIATLLRLMFVSLHHRAKSNLHNILSDVCKNTQNRAEVISILLSILADGTADVQAVERSFASLSLRAKQLPAGPKTPTTTPLKRTTTGTLVTPGAELSPLNIVQQCLSTLNALTNDNPRVPSFFLTEHETISSQKAKSAKKGKANEVRAAKFPLNALLALLDRKLITENTSVMETLAALLNRVTQPLTMLLKRQKAAEEAEKKKVEEAEKKESEGPESRPQTAGGDVQMGEASAEASTSAEAPPVGSSAVATEPPTAAAADENAEGSAEKSSKASDKKRRDPVPPEVPQENLRSVVNIITARECPTKTFSDTLDLIKNLSNLPGAKEVFGRELVSQAQELSKAVLVELEDLATQINAAQTGTDMQGVALTKFSSSASKQTKLLRVLVALDHLFDPQRTPELPSRGEDMTSLKQDVLAALHDSSTFDKLWANLSQCLTAIRNKGNMVNVAAILLPMIEALLVVCRNSTSLKDQSAEPGSPVAGTPTTEAKLESLFFRFTEEHRKILNELIRNNPKLMHGNLAVLAKNSKVLEFDNKRNYFNRKVHDRREQRVAHPSLQLNVRREQVFLDSFKSLYYKSGEEIKYGKLNIRFVGEEGIDAGGVSREWFAAMARQIFNPDYALFNPVASDRTTFHPNEFSDVNPEHLLFFRFIGRIIGKALYEGRLLDCHFSRAVYRRILGKTVSLKDLESLELDHYKSLVWVLENDITDIITETFSIETDRFGEKKIVDLKENGRDIEVTEENKQEWVRLIVEHKLVKSVESQLNEFLAGFHDIIPAELISIFNEQELELLISGLPDIDVDDWKNNTEYHNYQSTSPQIQWFWRAVRSFDKEEKAKLLQFVTGTSKVPLNGFKELEGMNGFAKFNVHRDYSSKEKLPSSHTCFNQLDLPEYESYEHLRQQLYTAITAGSEYFGFA